MFLVRLIRTAFFFENIVLLFVCIHRYLILNILLKKSLDFYTTFDFFGTFWMQQRESRKLLRSQTKHKSHPPFILWAMLRGLKCEAALNDALVYTIPHCAINNSEQKDCNLGKSSQSRLLLQSTFKIHILKNPF